MATDIVLRTQLRRYGYTRWMAISVELSNLGPLRSAQAEVSGLTLLVGANNTGKTCFATVLHRVLGASYHYRPPLSLSGRSYDNQIPGEVRDWIDRVVMSSDEDTVDQLSPLEPSSDTIKWATAFITSSLRDFARYVRDELEYAFGVGASELCRNTEAGPTTNCFVRVRNTELEWVATIYFDSDRLEITPPDVLPWLEHTLEPKNMANMYERFTPPPGNRWLDFSEPASLALNLFRTQWDNGLYKPWPREGVHLPAGRTAIMHSHQILTGTIVRRSVKAGSERIQIGPFSGTTADLLALLVETESQPRYEQRDKNITSLVKQFEKELDVTIEIEEKANRGHTIVAVTPEGVFPMSRTSSMISELAPIVVALKYWLNQGDFLTVDEPEAHLHPEMQRAMADLITDIVDSGITVILTTHSDFLLGELNNSIRKGRLKISNPVGKENNTTGYTDYNLYALFFERTDEGCIGSPLEVDPIKGIDESTFSDVMRSLYQESAQLINSLLRQ